MKKIVLTQFFVLLCGTLFAWVNFTLELLNWLKEKNCTISCSVGLTNPFFTPCFYGALFFSAAFILNLFLWRQLNRQK